MALAASTNPQRRAPKKLTHASASIACGENFHNDRKRLELNNDGEKSPAKGGEVLEPGGDSDERRGAHASKKRPPSFYILLLMERRLVVWQ